MFTKVAEESCKNAILSDDRLQGVKLGVATMHVPLVCLIQYLYTGILCFCKSTWYWYTEQTSGEKDSKIEKFGHVL